MAVAAVHGLCGRRKGWCSREDDYHCYSEVGGGGGYRDGENISHLNRISRNGLGIYIYLDPNVESTRGYPGTRETGGTERRSGHVVGVGGRRVGAINYIKLSGDPKREKRITVYVVASFGDDPCRYLCVRRFYAVKTKN